MEIGNAYLFFTMTFYWTGRLVAMTPTDFVVEEAAQVFDLGELEHALATGDVRLCQAVPDKVRVFIPRSGTTTLTWPKALPRKSKKD